MFMLAILRLSCSIKHAIQLPRNLIYVVAVFAWTLLRLAQNFTNFFITYHHKFNQILSFRKFAL